MFNVFFSDFMLLQTIYFYPEVKDKITHLSLFGSICSRNRITKDKIKNTVDKHSVCNWDDFISSSPSNNTKSLTSLKVNTDIVFHCLIRYRCQNLFNKWTLLLP